MTSAASTSNLPLALSQIRESDSVVRGAERPGHRDRRPDARDAQRQDYRTPLLGDVPVLGNLFKSERDQTQHRGAGAAAAPAWWSTTATGSNGARTADRAAALAEANGKVERQLR